MTTTYYRHHRYQYRYPCWPSWAWMFLLLSLECWHNKNMVVHGVGTRVITDARARTRTRRSSTMITTEAGYPSHISITAGVFQVPPYVFLDQVNSDDDDGSILSATGFCPDMLERLQVFAAQDNVTLDVTLKLAPNTYDGALDLVANDCMSSLSSSSSSSTNATNATTDTTNVTTADSSSSLRNNNEKDDCEAFDLIAVDYYYTADRALRIDYSPVWLHGAISAVKYVPGSSSDNTGDNTENALSTYVDNTGTTEFVDEFITMAQASREGMPVCVVEATSIVPITMSKFPGANYIFCPDQQNCLDLLKENRCRLYVDDRLQLRYRAVSDPTLVVSQETFNQQYISWVLNQNMLDPMSTRLLNRWLIAAHQNGTFSELYEKYFEKELCPPGRAGPSCDLPCNERYGHANVHGDCICKTPKWTGDDCSTEVPEELNLIPKSLQVVAYCLLGINGVLILGCVVWLKLHRASQQVQISQPSFLLLVLLGCTISSATILAMGQQDSGDDDGSVPICMFIPWLYSVGFCVTFGTLFAKIRRVYILFRSSAECRRVEVTPLENMAVIASVLAVDVIILIVWTFYDPLQWTREVITTDQFGESLESEGYCTCEHWVVFTGIIGALHFILLVVASWMCYMSRHIPTKFSEGKYVAISMASNLQIFVVGVPVLVVVGSHPSASFFVRSAVIWMNDLVVLVLIFGNLIYSVWYHTGIDRRSQVGREISTAIQRFSAHNVHDNDEDMQHSAHSWNAVLQEINRTWQKAHSLTPAKTTGDSNGNEPDDSGSHNSLP